MKMDRPNLGCWTIGQHAQKNMLPAISSSKLVNLAGMYTRNSGVLEEQRELYQCKAYESAQDMLSEADIDAIYISSPTGVHAAQVEEVLRSGKHVLVEKSAFASFEESVRLADRARRSGLLIMEAFMYRFHRQFVELKSLLDSDKYGAVKELDCRFGFPHLPAGDIRYSRLLAGGALNDAGAYTISAARNLIAGPIQLAWASSGAEEPFEVDTRGAAVMQNNNRQIAKCSWGFGVSYVNEIRIWCERGHIIVDRAFSKPATFDSKIDVVANSKIVECIHSGCDNHFVKMLDHFAEVVACHDSQVEYEELLAQAKTLESIRQMTE